MTRRLRAARCITQRHTPEALWITDDVLADTFRRFASLSVRHGSHVPGPLEARKRAAKRKNTSLAHIGPSPPIDSTLLFAKKSESGWWKATPVESTPVDSAINTTRILPSWLTEPSDYGETISLETVPEAPDFESDLACCESVADLRSVIRSHGLNLRYAPEQTEQIYRHVVSRQWPATTLMEYFAEPGLHPSGCQNHVKFVQRLAREYQDSHFELHKLSPDWDLVLNGMCRAVKLGLLSAIEWAKVVDAVVSIELSLYRQGQHHPFLHRTLGSASNSIMALLDSFEQSHVLSFKDIDHMWFKRLSKTVMQAEDTLTTVRVIWRLRRARRPHGSPSVADALVRCLTHYSAERDPEAIATFLLELPRTVMLMSITRVSEILSFGIVQGSHDASLFTTWKSILRSLNGSDRKRFTISTSDLSIMRGSSGDTSLGRPQLEILLLWNLRQLLGEEECHEQLKHFDLHPVVSRIFDNRWTGTLSDLHCQIVLNVQSLPLPDKESFLASLSRLFKDREMASSRSQQENHTQPDLGPATLLKADLARLVDRAIHNHPHYLSQKCLAEEVEKVTYDMDGFKRLLRHLVAQDADSFRVVRPILQSSIAFKTALSHAWPQRLDWQQRRDMGIAMSTVTDVTQHLNKPEPFLDPEQVLDVVHQLAISFATSPAISPRQSLRQVYWCYRYLMRYGAPIQPPMTRALWHAGVTRYDWTGPGDIQLFWILDKVRKVEGEEVAQQLMRSISFRQWRSVALQQLARGIPDFQPDMLVRFNEGMALLNVTDPKEVEAADRAQVISARIAEMMERVFARKEAKRVKNGELAQLSSAS
ncbi:uncharacterized protein HMPREF1541_05573 [Cyphellophora europaea CBS 101466]|uniref:Uncharacterized protein n=1 Tax=Cyphellophora europaea (strain CBS 101466) TaxID=1220924 RepID=W2RSR4_CYPE1|nr:uncharacterized protein HMPREF1541_05573 [Cyphellophora europaea CBS 101466]ETN39350.1 hypothetical protein HMPREF1541_05573 [Cyphellophora europaea CBS 101466]